MRVRGKAIAALCGLSLALVAGVATAGPVSATPRAVGINCSVPLLIPSASSVAQGGSLTLDGNCFTADADVVVTFTDGSLTTPVGTAHTDSGGGFTGLPFLIPANAAPGSGSFTGDDGSKPSAEATVTITACSAGTPILTVTPTSSPIDGTVAVAGGCFADTSLITLSLTGGDGSTAAPPLTTDPASITSDPSGAFTASFFVPAGTTTGSDGAVTATDAASNSATTDLAVTACTPAITLSPTSTAAGTTVAVAGSCFTPTKTVSLSFKDSGGTTTDVTPTPPATVEGDGTFTASIAVPATAATGAGSVTATDSAATPATASTSLTVTAPSTPTCSSTSSSTSTTSSSTNSSSSSVVYTATMSAAPATVAAGGSVKVTGDGFTPCSTVTLTLHSDPVALGTATADATGAFTMPVTIPAATAAGSHTITGTSSTVNGIATLTVTAAGASSSSAASSSSSSGTTAAAAAAASSGKPLAFTGADVALFGSLGLLLVLAGGTVAYLARRRRLENARWHHLS